MKAAISSMKLCEAIYAVFEENVPELILNLTSSSDTRERDVIINT